MTLIRDTCDRLLMRLSVMPSERYSVSGSALALTKGKTATESMALPPRAK
jgi:hypothetical protein